MAKRESKVATDFRAIDGEIFVDFKVADGAAYTLSISDLPDSDGTDEGITMMERLAIHGACQKVVDSVAGEKDIAAVSKKIGGMVAQIQAGQWFAERQSDGVNIGVLAEAMAEFSQSLPEEKRMTAQTALAKLVTKTKEEKVTLRKYDKIAGIYDRIVAERAAAKRAEEAPKVAEAAEAILADF